jgi:hypothetical protein
MDEETWTSPEDIAKPWRPLTDAEQERAQANIEIVERALLHRWPDLRTRVAAGVPSADDVKDVVYFLVRPLVEVDPDIPLRAKAFQETSGSESQSITLDGPLSGVVLTLDGWMVDRLAPPNDPSTKKPTREPLYAAPDPGDFWDRAFPGAPEGRY